MAEAPKPKKWAKATDLSRSVAFYQDVFGFQIHEESDTDGRRYAFLGPQEQAVLTLWQQSRGDFSSCRPGLHHLAFRVATVADVEEVERRLRLLGARIYHNGPVAHREGQDSGGIFFEDPDGIRLEVYAPAGLQDHHAPNADAPTCGFF